MGKIILHVDILEILSLAWDHPLVTGGLVLMFTPPLFPVLVFFSPLLISTALCAVALISVGHHIEAAREREIEGSNARVVDGDHLSGRFVNARRRNRVAGEESWLDSIKGFELGSLWKNADESTLIDDVKEGGLKAEFRVDEGETEEGFSGRQIEDFRGQDRSFGFRTGARGAAAGIAVATANARRLPGVPVNPFSTEAIPFPSEGINDRDGVSAPNKIPPIFLHSLRTGGTGTIAKLNGAAVKIPSGAQAVSAAASGTRNEAAPELHPFGTFKSSEVIDVVERGPGEQGDPQQQPKRFVFKSGNGVPLAAETQVSPVAVPMNMNNFAEKNVFLRSPISADDSLEGEFAGFKATAFEGKDSPKSLRTPRSSVIKASVAPPVKPFDESSKFLNYNATLRSGNAVIYNSSSDNASARVPLGRQRSAARQTRHSLNQDRTLSTSTRQRRRHLARENSPKHPS